MWYHSMVWQAIQLCGLKPRERSAPRVGCLDSQNICFLLCVTAAWREETVGEAASHLSAHFLCIFVFGFLGFSYSLLILKHTVIYYKTGCSWLYVTSALSCFNMAIPLRTMPSCIKKWFFQFDVEELAWPAQSPDPKPHSLHRPSLMLLWLNGSQSLQPG